MTTLVTVAHGTRQAAGNEVARRLTALVEPVWQGPVLGSYVELCEPLYADVMAELDGLDDLVVVPLLLSTGFHVRHDLPASLPPGAALAAPLGPSALLAAVQVRRLIEAGAAPGVPVTMVAAGSRDPAASADLDRAADLLAEAWGGPVRLATLAGLGSRPEDVVRPGDVISPYLLASGHFADRARVPGHRCAEVIGPHPDLVDLVLQRAQQALLCRGSSKPLVAL